VKKAIKHTVIYGDFKLLRQKKPRLGGVFEIYGKTAA